MVRPLVQGLVLVAASLALTTPALAGDFIQPFSSDACAGIFSPYESLDDPNVFGGLVECESLCKATEKDCEKFTKDAYNCEVQLAKDNRDYAKKQCENIEDKDLRNICKDTAKVIEDNQIDGAKDDRDDATDLCQSWGDICVVMCGVPL